MVLPFRIYSFVRNGWGNEGEVLDDEGEGLDVHGHGGGSGV